MRRWFIFVLGLAVASGILTLYLFYVPQSDDQIARAAEKTMREALDGMGGVDIRFVRGPVRRIDLDTENFRVFEYRTIPLEPEGVGRLRVYVSVYRWAHPSPSKSDKWEPRTTGASWEGPAWQEVVWRSKNGDKSQSETNADHDNTDDLAP